MHYAGIGSRDTPSHVLEYFSLIATFFATKGVVLRSGAAQGADKAFEIGCDKINGQKEIYLPWRYFEKSDSDLVVSNPRAYEIAEQFHPYWNNLKDGAKKLQARNTHQVLGWDLESPSTFVMCWTKNGKGLGGTGQAIRIANHYGVPVFDAGSYETVDEIKKELKQFLIDNGVFSEEELSK
jgi:hypothetical protein